MLVRCPALSPIKPQAPPVVVLPRQFLEVSSLRTYFPGGLLSGFPTAQHPLVVGATPSRHCLRPGLPGYLILFETLAFVPHCRIRSRDVLSPSAVRPGLRDFTPTPDVPVAPSGPKPRSFYRAPTC